MNNLLGKIKISTKILSLLSLLGLLCLGITLYSNSALKSTDETYSKLVNEQMTGTIKLVRFHRLVSDLTGSGFRAVAYDGGSALARQNAEDSKQAYAQASAVLKEALALRPELKEQIDEMFQDLDQINAIVQQAIGLGLRNDNVAATQLLQNAKPLLDELQTDLVAINGKAVADAEQRSVALSDEAASSARATLIVSILGTLAALGLGFMVARAGIITPINNITRQMRRLAEEGDTTIAVPCVVRKDELGAIAKALVVFRDNAVESNKAAEAKGVADAAQAKVVHELADNLGKLAGGDLTVSLNGFPADYRKLEEDFNAAVSELRGALSGISRATGNIHGGSGEISQASDDLSRRTEQQAASLEETAAAMTEITTTVQNSATG
ncbi:MAG TPA: HAMP domain-containing protein, partial [Allosphingosinicella sp.]